MDPIDGTMGFLRGGQYAVCLGLLQDGEVVLGVMGCPNLPVDYHNPEGEKGVIFVAVKGQGAFQVRLPPFFLLTPCRLTIFSSAVAQFARLVPHQHGPHFLPLLGLLL